MRKIPRLNIGIFLISILLLSTGGCGGSKYVIPTAHLTPAQLSDFEHTSFTGKWGGAFVDATISDPRTFNPITTKESSSSVAWGPLFTGLIARNPLTLKIEPELAKRWTQSANGLVWTFYLRRGLLWSDGQPLTAHDVVFTLDVIFDTTIATTLRTGMLVNGQPWKVAAINSTTVQITLPSQFGSFLTVVGVPIVPAHILEPLWKQGKFNSAWGVNTPVSNLVGNGPFCLAHYSPGASLTYVRNPYYWKLAKNGRQLPFLKGGVIEIVPNENTEILKFIARETDWVSIRPEDCEVLENLRRTNNFSLYNLGPTWATGFIEFNMNSDDHNLPAWKRKIFSNKIFRQAVSFALNRKLMASTVLRGFGQPLYGYIPPANKLFYNPKIPTYPYNPAKSIELLKSIGLTFHNGVLEDAQGNAVQFTLTTNSGNNLRAQTCAIIQAELKQIGIEVNISLVDFNSLVSRLDGSHDWDAILLGFTGGVDPHTASAIWMTTGPLHEWDLNQKTPATKWEAKIDKLFTEAADTESLQKQIDLYNQFQVIASTELPLIYTTDPDSLVAVRNTLHNAEPSSLADSNGDPVGWRLYAIWKS